MINLDTIPVSVGFDSPVIWLLQRDLVALKISPVIYSVRAVSHNVIGVATIGTVAL